MAKLGALSRQIDNDSITFKKKLLMFGGKRSHPAEAHKKRNNHLYGVGKKIKLRFCFVKSSTYFEEFINPLYYRVAYLQHIQKSMLLIP